MISINVDLVFEGGGVLGISFVGAYTAFVKHGYKIIRSAGTSAGSVISALIMAGFSPEELEQELSATNFKLFMEKTLFKHVPVVGNLLSLIFNKGVYDGSCIENWIGGLLKKKGITVFGDLMRNNESPLKIIAADISHRKLLILPDDVKIYGLDPKTFSIAQAVRMSCTIPYFYTPVKWKNGQEQSYIVDGGVLSTFPIWVFEQEGKLTRPTLGIKIQDKNSLTLAGRNNLLAFTMDLINAVINKDDMTYVHNKDLVRTIIIENVNNLKATDFMLDDKQIKQLYDSGYEAVDKFLGKWRYTDYIKEFMLTG